MIEKNRHHKKPYSKLKVIFVSLLLMMTLSEFLSSQTIIEDSLTISLRGQEKCGGISVDIDTVVDQRDEAPNMIGMYEKKKYLFIPVDLFIHTKEPLADEIRKALKCEERQPSSLRLKLVVDDFSLTKNTNSFIYPRYLCHASIHVYQVGDNKYLGQLLYESVYSKYISPVKMEKGFQKVVDKWTNEFCGDLIDVTKSITDITRPQLDNFRPYRYLGKRVNMMNSADFTWGSNGWIVDGEILFSHREPKKLFFRNGYNLRFRHEQQFESIEFSLSSDYLFYRLRSKLLFRLKSMIMYGFNRWNDIKDTDHKVWDAFIIDYSLSQALFYNPLDKRSIILGLGLVENVYYVYSQHVQFQMGIMLNLGVKL